MTSEIKNEIVELLKEIKSSPEALQMKNDWDIIMAAFTKTSWGCDMTPEQKAAYAANIVKEYPDNDIVSKSIRYPLSSLRITPEVEYDMNMVRWPSLMAKMNKYWSLLKRIPITDKLDVASMREIKNYALNDRYDDFLLLDGSQFIFSGMRAFLHITYMQGRPGDEFYNNFIDGITDLISEM